MQSVSIPATRLESISQISHVEHMDTVDHLEHINYTVLFRQTRRGSARARKCKPEVVLSSTSNDTMNASSSLSRTYAFVRSFRPLVRSLARISVHCAVPLRWKEGSYTCTWVGRLASRIPRARGIPMGRHDDTHTIGRFGKLLAACRRKSPRLSLSFFLQVSVYRLVIFFLRVTAVLRNSTRLVVVVARDISTRTNVTISYGIYKFINR